MKKHIATLVMIVAVIVGMVGLGGKSVYAADKEVYLDGKIYDLCEKDKYDLSKGKETNEVIHRIYVKGEILSTSKKDGFASYAVENGNLKILVDNRVGQELNDQSDSKKWHIIKDSTDEVNGTELNDDIETGAIIIQTSKDGKIWVTANTETDIYNRAVIINNQIQNGENINAFYETTNVQINNGCYYRIIVAYKLEREIDPSKVLFVTKKEYEEKECAEIYQFYVYNPSINGEEELIKKDAYQFKDKYRVDSVNGFDNPSKIQSDDPHNNWEVGRFYVSGFTDFRKEGDVVTFLKTPGDKAALWFSLEQELDKCNGRTDIQVNYTDTGSDINFNTPTIENVGRGMLIVKKTDKGNKSERQIYTNYLEATATVGANTRVDLFEEGDYEVALDYELHYDKPFVFGTTTTKTLPYQIAFKFNVRNGDISMFLRKADSGEFIKNSGVAEKGFYIDVSNSQYLNMSIKREVLSDSMDGLVEDTKFSAVAKEGRNYTDEGIYTVTVKNPATGDSVEKRVYVGDKDIMRAHMKTGIPISEIKVRLENGATVDEYGNINDPEPEPEPEPEDLKESEDIAEGQSVSTNATDENNNSVEAEAEKTGKKDGESVISGNNTEYQNEVKNDKDNKEGNESNQNVSLKKYVLFSLIVVLVITGLVAYKKKGVLLPNKKEEGDKE